MKVDWPSWEECLAAVREPCDPPRLSFTAEERRLVRRLDSPARVQAWLNGLPYNWERGGLTMRTFRGVVREGTAHCLEAVLAAATILEQHGYPPVFLDLDSKDGLGHVLLLERRSGRFGTVARSRDPGLHGRKPVYRNLRTLVQSYVAPYIDATGCVTGYGLLDLRRLPRKDWRLAPGNVWYVEQALLDPARPGFRRLRVPRPYYQAWHGKYMRFLKNHPDRKPTFYPTRATWRWR